MIKLFVVGFPPEMQEVELIELFVLYGMIHSISVVKDKVSHQSLGYCFIEMVDQTGADRAIDAINQTMVRGRRITVKLADKKTAGQHQPSAKPHHTKAAATAQKPQRKEENTPAPKNKRPRKSSIPSKDSVISE